MEAFVHDSAPVRVVFGAGTIGEAGAEVARLGRSRPLVLSTPGQRAAGEALAERLAAPLFAGAAMHTPVDVTETALEAAAGADCLVAVGGGSAIGLSKAIAVRTGLDQVAIPTTYAGSEMTPILGETDGGRKTTRRDAAIRPETVIYDVDLTMTLPAAVSATSGLNAVAHAVEALYAPDRTPLVTLMALEGGRVLAGALPAIAARPDDREARGAALYGAWLCGAVLGATTMGLHHKLCHTLGGSFGLSHGQTHAVILPHAAAYNERAVPQLLAPLASVLGARAAAEGLFALAGRIGAPTTLRSLGFAETDIARAAALASERPYANPRPVTREGMEALLAAAFAGARPGA